MNDFRIDPEFQNKIPPIGAEEFKQLRENILAAGEVYEPLVVWNGILVDGHNRWKVIQEAPNIKWRVREMKFADKWAAFEWMYKNQLGRRNLTDEQRMYTIGKMYEARKNTNAFRGNQYTVESGCAQNEHKPRMSEQIAHEVGVGKETVKRAEKYAKGVDALRNVNPEAADKVLSGRTKASKTAVAEIAKLEHDEVEAAADAILSNMAMPNKKPAPVPKPPQPKPEGRTKEYREMREIIDNVIAAQTDPNASPAFDIDDLIAEIEINGENYVRGLRNTISIRTNLLTNEDAKTKVFKAISTVIQGITKVRGEYYK